MSASVPPLPDRSVEDQSAAIIYLGSEEIPLESPSLERVQPDAIVHPDQVRVLKEIERKREDQDRKQIELAQSLSSEWAHEEWRKRQTHWAIEWTVRGLGDAVHLAYQKGGYSGIWMHVSPPYHLTDEMIEGLRQEPSMIRCQWSLDDSRTLFLSFFEMSGESIWQAFKHFKHVHLIKKHR